MKHDYDAVQVENALTIDLNTAGELRLEETRDFIQQTIFLLDEWIADLRAQLDRAKLEAEQNEAQIDPEWLTETSIALRSRTMQRQQLHVSLGSLTRRLKAQALLEANDEHKRFVDAARTMLPRQTFAAIWRAVKRSHAA